MCHPALDNPGAGSREHLTQTVWSSYEGGFDHGDVPECSLRNPTSGIVFKEPAGPLYAPRCETRTVETRSARIAGRQEYRVTEYQALYRKYRPKRFSEIIGQDHVSRVLAREVREGRATHAFLFAGPRGTGKTSTARILSKAINCELVSEAGEPCGKCRSCQDIAVGSSMDVREFDAASHNSVENIRDIRAQVTMVATTPSSHRIFILDEAHMLSTAACNALLKTLEEPPPGVHFILATTEPYKLPDTIRSRSQRFDFHPVSMETLARHLGRISEQEGYEVDDNGLRLIARHARGSVRDSLSILEQVAAGGRRVDSEAVERALGVVDMEMLASLSSAIADSDAVAVLSLVSSLESRGVNLRSFLSDSIGFFRGAFLAGNVPDLGAVSDEPAEVIKMWREMSETLSIAEISRVITHLGEALMGIREGRDERVVVEMALLRLVRPDLSIQPADLLGRIEAMEAHFGQGAPPAPSGAKLPKKEREPPHPASTAVRPPAAAPAKKESPAPRRAAEAPARPASAFELDRLQTLWPDVVRGFSGMEAALLRQTAPCRLEGGLLTVDCGIEFRLERLRTKKAESRVAERIKEITGEDVEVELMVAKDGDTSLVRRSPRSPDMSKAPARKAEPEDIPPPPDEGWSERNGGEAPNSRPLDLKNAALAFLEKAGVTVTSVQTLRAGRGSQPVENR